MLRLCRGTARPAARAAVSKRWCSVPERMPLHNHDNLFTCANADYLESMFEQWYEDPNSVGDEMRTFFEKACTTDSDLPMMTENLRPLGMHTKYEGTPRSVINAMRVGWMLRLWAVRGHRLANLDPLNLPDGLNRQPAAARVSSTPLFHPADFGFREEDLDQVFHLSVSDQVGGFLALDQPPRTLRQLYAELKEVYAGPIGWEYMHINDATRQLWLKNRIETPTESCLKVDTKETLYWLARAELFEKFLQVKFVNVKRFGLDGGEVLIPGMKAMLTKSAELGVESVVMGMPHRGRLNVLANVCGKKFGAIFGEFHGGVKELDFGSGDVKYHLGMTEQVELSNGKKISVSLLANPSHLEAVNPLVAGKTRAKQLYTKDTDRSKTLSVVLHGDAAFAGQGVCFETMGLNDLGPYTVGGTIHIVVNNQIGFTTDPAMSRSTPYCSDLGKTFQAPVFHVNADATHEVVRVFQLAAEWRAKYHTDVVIDLICYRRYGHNESDEPLFTQPVMYKKIQSHPSQLTVYGNYLVDNGLMSRADIDAEIKRVNDLLKEDFQNMDQYKPDPKNPTKEWLESHWEGFKSPTQKAMKQPTSKDRAQLQALGAELNTLPEGFTPHPAVGRNIQMRARTIAAGKDIDWSTAEQLAFATLLEEGFHVRVSGQDCERGTFSQRHAVLHDQKTGEKHFPLEKLSTSQSEVTIVNSSLSEYGVLGFETGFASENPNQLVIWEAQFGDFANTAQIIFDQFLCAGEVKWYRQNGLVVNLPHGYDGAGPEHSSGRLERFLQQTPEPEEDPEIDDLKQIQQCNWQVCYPTTPAQYFHLLRRQLHRDFRKPLILFFAKSTLRAPNVSTIEDFEEPSKFQRVIPDDDVDADKVRKVIFCTGQIYFALRNERAKRELDDIALVRVEQLAPFPWPHVREQLEKYPNAEVQWCQEEPRNMGAWYFVEVRMQSILDNLEGGRAVAYNGRKAAAAPATGLQLVHQFEHKEIMEAAFA